MKKQLLLFIIATVIVTCLGSISSAHSGRTDASGGHYDRSTGLYHYHHGYPAHRHINGICPYENNYNSSYDFGYNMQVVTFKPERPVATIKPERPVTTITPERPVTTITPERPVTTITPERPVTTITPYSSGIYEDSGKTENKSTEDYDSLVLDQLSVPIGTACFSLCFLLCLSIHLYYYFKENKTRRKNKNSHKQEDEL